VAYERVKPTDVIQALFTCRIFMLLLEEKSVEEEKERREGK
jgi:hypothetical protein